MAIQPITGNTVSGSAQTKSVAKKEFDTKTQANSSPVTDDTVKLTSVAQGLKQANASGSEPVVNETRVAEIKTALEAGEYKVNPERIADKMLQMELKLPNST
jgi:negative regulator of flagellin synthesis FlgM